MKTEIIKVDAKETADKIVQSLAGGFISAAKEYRSYVDAGGDPMELRKHCPLSSATWKVIDDVACDRIDPRALQLPGGASRCILMLPRKTQSDVIERGVELLSIDGSTIRVRAEEMTANQAKQALSRDGVRSPSQQAAWLRAPDRVPPPAPVDRVYEVRRGKLEVLRPTTFTVSDLHRILAEMG